MKKKDLSILKKKIEDNLTSDLKKAFSIKDKQERSKLIVEAQEKCISLFENDENYSELDVLLELKNFIELKLENNVY